MSIFKKIILRQKANQDASRIVAMFKNDEDNNVIQVHDKQGNSWYVKNGAKIDNGVLVSTQDIPIVDGKEQFAAMVGLANINREVQVLPFRDLQLDDVETPEQAQQSVSDLIYQNLKTQLEKHLTSQESEKEGDRHNKLYLLTILFHIKKLFDTLLILGIIIILFSAIKATHLHSYYVFLHWYVLLYSIYLIYKARTIVIFGTKLGVILFYVAIAILFNPFMPFSFSRTTWRIIDFTLIVIYLPFLLLRIGDYYKELLSKIRYKG